MKNVIGKILKGSICGQDATFEVIYVRESGGDFYAIAECVEFGAPFQRILLENIDQPVWA